MKKRPVLLAVVGAALIVAAAWFYRDLREDRLRGRQSQTVVEAMRRVARLTTVEMNVSDWRLRSDEKALFGILPWPCRKTVAVFYRGKVAAGFDLKDDGPPRMVFDVDSMRRRVKVRLPRAQLLYLDVPPPALVVADGSICNQVTSDDYTRMAGEARAAIEQEALKSGILARAESQARELLTEVSRPLGYQVEVTFDTPTLSTATRGEL